MEELLLQTGEEEAAGRGWQRWRQCVGPAEWRHSLRRPMSSAEGCACLRCLVLGRVGGGDVGARH